MQVSIHEHMILVCSNKTRHASKDICFVLKNAVNGKIIKKRNSRKSQIFGNVIRAVEKLFFFFKKKKKALIMVCVLKFFFLACRWPNGSRLKLFNWKL